MSTETTLRLRQPNQTYDGLTLEVSEGERITRWRQRDARRREAESTNQSKEDTGTRRSFSPAKELEVTRLNAAAIRPAPREIPLQEWEGRVLRLEGRFLFARLVDITAGDKDETEEVQLPIDDVTEADQKLLKPGAVFRWVLGYSYANGRKERFARVVIRRLPVWTEKEMREADTEADELHDALFGNQSFGTAQAG